MRYVRAGKPLYVETPLWEGDNPSLVPHIDVDGPKIVDTGLIFEDGTPVMRIQPPIGFGRDEDW